MAVKPIPEGYHPVTPYLVVEDAAALIDFLKQALRRGTPPHGPSGRDDHARGGQDR
jgi:hypothetical protein